MSKSLRKALSASALCSLLLLTACGGRDVVAPPTAPVSPTGQASATSTPSPVASASPSPEASSPTPTSSPAAQETTQAPSPTAETSSEQAAPSPEVSPAEPLAQAGTNCGPSNTGRTTLVLAEGAASCAEVQQVFADFNAQFTGSTDPVNINGYTCQSYSQFETRALGRTVSCEGQGNRLEAMTSYHVGGIPLNEIKPYMMTSMTGHFAMIAKAHGVSCSFGEGNGFYCSRPTSGGSEGFYWDENGNKVVENKTEPSVESTSADLPVGYSMNAETGSCLNDGTYLVCSNGTTTFRFNATEFTEL